MSRTLTALAVCALVLTGSPALAAPTCPAVATRAACGGRVVAEAAGTTSLHQYDGALDSLEGSLKAIAAEAPAGFVTVTSIGKSAGGRDLWVAKVTDPSVPQAGKVQSAVSLSVHGLEPAGREGGIRYLEDLARWLKDEPAHPVYAGTTAYAVADVFRQVELYVGFLNPDGWAMQDLDADNNSAGATAPRYNDNGADLNRDFPTLGWVDRTGGRGPELDQPEAKAWWRLLTGLPDLRSASDIHGETTSTNSAFSDLLWPAGQWTPDKAEKELQLAKDMILDVERKFAEEGVVLADLFGPTIGQVPAQVATGYDAVGYDDSGFMGDAMSSLNDGKVVEIDTENFLSHVAPNVAWAAPLEAAHIAAVRGNIEAVLTTAIKERTVHADIEVGRVAYVDDPTRTTSKDGTGFALVAGETQTPYDVTRLQWFTDLADAIDRPVPGIPAADVAGADLSQYDSVVLSDVEVPKDTQGRAVDRSAYVKALKAFVESGGQLVLTDRAVRLLDDLGVLTAAAQTVQRTNAGHVDFVAGDHPLTKDLYGVPSQTYYEVPLGYPAENAAPNYGVTTTAWQGAGGTTVGTVGDSTVLGQLTMGKGRITVFGAVLPQAVETLDAGETPHPEGLAAYAVTIAGSQVLENVLAYTQQHAGPVQLPEDGDAGDGLGDDDLAATGGHPSSTVLALLALAAAGAVAVRRRRTR